MLLTININNTNTTMGLWDGRAWHALWRLRTVKEKTVDEYGINLRALLRETNVDKSVIDSVVMASVVPSLTGTFTSVSEQYLDQTPFQVRADTAGVPILTDNPAEVGADRIANTAGAYHLFPGPSIVIDMGTATTFDVVAADGALLGVAIAPGIQVAADALASRAAQLSHVALTAPPQAVGRNTVHAMQSGIVFGYTALVEGLVKRLLAEMPVIPEARLDGRPVKVIGTGGLISLITPHTTLIDYVDPWLTLTGLRVIAERSL